MAFRKGDVVLVPFPFRERATTKVRPAAVLSGRRYNQRGDLIVAAITTHPPRAPTDYQLTGWRKANLLGPSTVRMQLATLDQRRVLFRPGRLTRNDLTALDRVVQETFEL